MSNFYYNLSGGINTAKTRIGMGQDTKRLYWWDSKNVEILKNQGVCRQKGNVKLFDLNPAAGVLALHEYPKSTPSFVFATSDGKIYSYNHVTTLLTLLHTFETAPNAVSFTPFLDGIIIAADNNAGVYYKQGKDIEPLGLQDADGAPIPSATVGVFASRVWIAKGSTIYFSALGTYKNWTSTQDAGYISKFHSSTTDIVAMKEYCNNFAIYKADGVYLLSGSSPEDFAVTRLANIGTISNNSVVCADNKQYFINENGVFYLGQAGMLSQIALSSNIADNIKTFFEQINYSQAAKAAALLYEIKNQIWFFIPKVNAEYLSEVYIYDFACDAWFKRVIPYQITAAATVCGKIYTATFSGEVFAEDKGNTFAGLPIEFQFSSPFFHLGAPTVRKIVEDFNFIFDEEYENRFNKLTP